MRNYETLDTVTVDANTGLLYVTSSGASAFEPRIAMRREGVYVVMSASSGPLEISLRMQYDALVRTLTRLQPIGGLQTTRDVGTSRAFISVGLRADSSLVFRPTIVGDAAGHLALNFALASDARQALFDWLNVGGE